MDAFSFPQKTREFHNHHFNSTVWNDFRFRDDDIVIATYANRGTTWTSKSSASWFSAVLKAFPSISIRHGSICAFHPKR